MIIVRCKQCEKILNISNIYRKRDVDGSPLTICNHCGDDYLKKMKEKRFVKEYSGKNIYIKDNIYYSDWCYGFNSIFIKDVEKYIDFRIANPNLIKL